MLYKGNKVERRTLKHAIRYLEHTKIEYDRTAATAYSSFYYVVGKVRRPCRAVGVAKEALKDNQWNVNIALKYLKGEQ